MNNLNSNKFAILAYSLFDEDNSGALTFEEYIVATWNMLTIEKSKLAKFSFRVFDKDNSGELTIEELQNLVDIICGASTKNNEKFMKDVKKKLGSNPCKIDDFVAIVKDASSILFPVFEMLLNMKLRTLGKGRWSSLTRIRTRKFADLDLDAILSMLPLKPDCYTKRSKKQTTNILTKVQKPLQTDKTITRRSIQISPILNNSEVYNKDNVETTNNEVKQSPERRVRKTLENKPIPIELNALRNATTDSQGVDNLNNKVNNTSNSAKKRQQRRTLGDKPFEQQNGIRTPRENHFENLKNTLNSDSNSTKKVQRRSLDIKPVEHSGGYESPADNHHHHVSGDNSSPKRNRQRRTLEEKPSSVVVTTEFIIEKHSNDSALDNIDNNTALKAKSRNKRHTIETTSNPTVTTTSKGAGRFHPDSVHQPNRAGGMYSTMNTGGGESEVVSDYATYIASRNNTTVNITGGESSKKVIRQNK